MVRQAHHERMFFIPGGAQPRMETFLADGELRQTWVGLRPASPDGLPILGPVPVWEGITVASGHFRNGILLSAITGQLMAELITTGRTSVSLEPYSLARLNGNKG